MESNLVLFVSLIIIIWLCVISFFLWRDLSRYNKLGQGLKDKNLRSIMESLLNDLSVARKDINNLKLHCDKIEKDGLLHIQKIGMIRFNPFKDTGGDQSFILSLVDGNNTGVVMSGLYARSGTRWYAKKIVKGKSVEHKLSEEEEKALKEHIS